MSDLLSVEAALAGVLGQVEPLPPVTVPADWTALGLVAAGPVEAATALPPWDNSAMDGYALRSADVAGASEARPVELRVIGEVAAGSASTTIVQPGTALRIATGAPVPAGADAVVAVEATTPIDRAGTRGPRGRDAAGPLPSACHVHEAVTAGANIRRSGSDLGAGTTLLRPGDVLTAAAIALVAGSGVPEVRVHPRPRIAVLATGDEVRPAGAALGSAGIPDANGPGLAALAAAAGATPVRLGIAPDRLDVVEAAVRRGIASADAVLVSGGVSVGPYDVVRLAFEAVGRVDLWRVAVQPGKPFAFGSAIAEDGRHVPLFGLPGNPVSGFVTFELFVRPALRRLAGRSVVGRANDRGLLLDRATKSRGRRAYLRVVAQRAADGRPERDADGRVPVRLAGGQGSHVLSALAVADALAVVPEPLEAVGPDAPVDLLWLDR